MGFSPGGDATLASNFVTGTLRSAYFRHYNFGMRYCGFNPTLIYRSKPLNIGLTHAPLGTQLRKNNLSYNYITELKSITN